MQLETKRPMDLTALNFARYRFYWQVTSPIQLPPFFAGSALRGIFGHALKQQSCLTRAETCEGCPVVADCPYAQIFEPLKAYQPADKSPALTAYAIETPFSTNPKPQYLKATQHYQFDMVLMTAKMIKHLPLITSAWKKAFAKGIGYRNGRAKLLGIQQLQPDGTQTTANASNNSLPIPAFSQAQNLQLNLQTPLRIQHKSKLINQHDINPAIFLRHLIRRISFHSNQQNPNSLSMQDIQHLNQLADNVSEGTRQLNWSDWQRHSSRQEKTIKLGGIIGNWQLLQVPPTLQTLLYLGQWLHVGKQIALGLGQYQYQQVNKSGGYNGVAISDKMQCERRQYIPMDN